MGVIKRYIHQSLQYSSPTIDSTTDRFIILRNLSQSNNTGLIGQISALFEYTHEIFSEIAEEASETAKKIQSLGERVQSLQQSLPTVERETPLRQRLVNTGKNFSNQSPEDACQFLPQYRVPSMIHQYNECKAPPNLALLDSYAGESCLKKYTDPMFFLESWVEEQNRMYQEAKKKRAARRKRVRETKQATTKIEVRHVELRRNKYSAMGQEFSPTVSREQTKKAPPRMAPVTSAPPVSNSPLTPAYSHTRPMPAAPVEHSKPPQNVSIPAPAPQPVVSATPKPAPVPTPVPVPAPELAPTPQVAPSSTQVAEPQATEKTSEKSKTRREKKSKEKSEKKHKDKKTKKPRSSSKKDKKKEKIPPPPTYSAPPPPPQDVAPPPPPQDAAPPPPDPTPPSPAVTQPKVVVAASSVPPPPKTPAPTVKSKDVPPPPKVPANLPPPPKATIPVSTGASSGLAGQLANVGLKSVPQNEQGDKKPLEKRSALLSAIQAGTTLKKVDTEALKANKKVDHGGFDVAKILARRAAIEFSDEDDDDNSYDDDDWEV